MTTPTQAEIIKLNFGDTIPIGQILANLILMGIVTDPLNPDMFAATLQAFQSQAVLTVPVLQGPQGDPGQPSFALRWQNEDLSDPSQLPTDLGNTDADLGKFWIFGVLDENGNTVATTMYIWWGTTLGFRQLPVGAPGPPGPYPVITPNIVIEEPFSGNGPGGVSSWIHVDGPASNPVFTFHIAAPQGPPGPAAALGSCPDVDFTTRVPQPGDTLMCTARTTPGAPTALTITPHSTGGTLAAGTYFYKVSSTITNGESLGGNEVTSGPLTGSTNSVDLSWTAPSGGGATGYKVWRGTAIGAEDTLVAVITDGDTTTFTDDGSSSTPAEMPSVGVVAGRKIWVAAPMPQTFPMIYTIPESAFVPQFGVGAASITVGTFAVPQQAWKWKPIIFGKARILGANISLTPLLLNVEVRLGSPNGTLVARGSGNSLGYVQFAPHTSDPGNPSAAMTPTNAYGLVQANHVGDAGTLYINVVNEGMAGVYDFETADAQMFIAAWPVPQ